MDAPPVIAGLTLCDVLGRGGFATVWAGERDGAPVAVKIARCGATAAASA